MSKPIFSIKESIVRQDAKITLLEEQVNLLKKSDKIERGLGRVWKRKTDG